MLLFETTQHKTQQNMYFCLLQNFLKIALKLGDDANANV